MNKSPFASIFTHEVLEVLKYAGYAAGAAAASYILSNISAIHLGTLGTVLLVPALKFLVTFFSSGAPSTSNA